MGTLHVKFHFAVPGLWVDHALLGRRYRATFEGRRIFLQLPAREGDFGIGDSTQYYPLIAGGIQSPDGQWNTVKLTMVRIGIEIPVDFSIPPVPIEPDLFRKITDLLGVAAEISKSFLKSYLDLVSVKAGQHWLGTQAQTPELTWITQVHDEHGNDTHIGFGGTGATILVHHKDSAITESIQADLLRSVERGTQIPIAESFLRDAKFLALEGKDAAQTMICAAIACELKVKGALVDLASPGQVELVNLMIGKSREFSLAVSALFDKGCKAVAGKSMRESDKALFVAAAKLFEARNAIAHRGESPSMGEVRGHVAIAVRVFEWMDRLASDLREPARTARSHHRLKIRNSSTLRQQARRP
jgi:hypothetical protein